MADEKSEGRVPRLSPGGKAFEVEQADGPSAAEDSTKGSDSGQPKSAALVLDEINDDRIPTDSEVAAVIAELPKLREQVTLRGILTAICLGVPFCIITMKLNFGSAGINPSLNIPGGLLSFAILRAFTKLGDRFGWGGLSIFGIFTPQENAVVQTMTSACYNIAGYAGFGSYLLAMSYLPYLTTGGVPCYPDCTYGAPNATFPICCTPTNTSSTCTKPPADPSGCQLGYDPDVIYQPDFNRIYPYLALLVFTGIFVLIALRHLMIVKWKLPYPSGTASGMMINSLHAKGGEEKAKLQVKVLASTAVGSFLFDTFKWFWQGQDYGCGFMVWPNLGFPALHWTWNFDSQQQYVGAGMLVPHIVAWSMLLGAIISWGILWPELTKKAGDWYPAGLTSKNFKGLFGYKVWLTIALLMGEGTYMLVKALVQTWTHIWANYKAQRRPLPVTDEDGTDEDLKDLSHGAAAGIYFKETRAQRKLRARVFDSDRIPWWVSPVGYTFFAVLGTICIPFIYKPAKWYYVLTAYAFGPFIALPNSYGSGLTDQDNCSMYAKLGLFIIAAWAGTQGNGVIAGCAICGVIMVATTNAAVLMQDFRTAYITLASPRAMLIGQVIGAALGVILTPLSFALFWKTGLVGVQDGPYPNPFAVIYRGMGIIGTEGFDALPKYCGALSGGFFAAALVICGIRDLLPDKYARFVPSPMGMGFSFYIGANNALDFWLGTVIIHIWEWLRPDVAGEYGPLAGAGLIVGDGLFAIPSSIIAIAGKAPPVCMAWFNGDSSMAP